MKRAITRTHRFVRVYSDLLVELFRFSPGKTIAVLASQFAAPALLSTTVLLLREVVKFLSAGTSPRLQRMAPEFFENQLLVLAAFSIVVALVGVAGAFTAWWGAAGARKLGRYYRLYFTGNVLETVSSLPLGRARIPGPLADQRLLAKLTSSYGLKLNLAVTALFTAVRAIITAIVLSVTLFVISVPYGLALITLAVVALPVYYLIGKQTHQSSRLWMMEGKSKETTGKLTDLSRLADSLPQSNDAPGVKVRSEEIEKDPVIVENLISMEKGRLAVPRSNLYGGIVKAVALGACVFTFGYLSTTPAGLSWETVIAFLVTAALMLSAATTMFASFSNLAWFSPMISATGDFAGHLRNSVKASGEGGMDQPTNDKTKVSPTHGKVLVLSPLSIGRLSYHYLLQRLYRRRVIAEPPERFEFIFHDYHVDVNDFSKLPKPVGRMILNQGTRKIKVTNIFKWFGKLEVDFALVFARDWDDDIDLFDYVVYIDPDGEFVEGTPAWWNESGMLERYTAKLRDTTKEEEDEEELLG